MWGLWTADFPPRKASQALRLTGIQEENDNIPTKEKADNLRPLRNTEQLDPKENEANSKLKEIEKEYTQKLAKSSQIIAELQTTISSLKEEITQQQLAAERRLQDLTQKFEDEKKQLIRDNDRAIKVLQDELETRSNQVRSVEKKLQHKELESQEQITYVRQEYETKFKGLMPASLRQELEDTISSLKSQVNFLQKRASILQEELMTYQGRR
ncbi:PREDICTED: centrosomal protein of 112 kDa isoform X4 [Chinchilla lanigera]|uniref:Centrosomal protein 112 n=1 Tax=Chinchilla lanigera TaxID=34839 RepID=A0A8C2YJX7_CHILA|nr:PREDICTED: centrosomal protein of 112 kDa isoform X4 [Chinchilla lanigera]